MRRISALLVLAAAGLGQEAEKSDVEAELTRRLNESCTQVSAALEAYLGKKFPAPVKVEWKTKREIGDFARANAKKMTPHGLIEVATRLTIRMRQVPAGYDILEEQMKLLEKNVAGIYDPEADTFYVARETGRPGTPMFTVTVAHELAHAYRDVDKDYYERTLAAVWDDGDWAQGVQFLVEGEATLLGYAIGQSVMSGTAPEDVMKLLLPRMGQQRDRMLAALNGPQFKGVPLIMKEFMIAPYAYGQVLAARIYEKGGLPALAAAFDNPPRSTEQVLHPAKYLGDTPDEPVSFEGGDPTAALGEGWALGFSNVMGEFEMQVHFRELLGRTTADRAAEGWDGSRYWFCEKAGATGFLGMITTWDTVRDAGEFAVAWARWAARRDGETRAVHALFDGLTPTGYAVDTKDGRVVVRIRGADVLIADGVPAGRGPAVFRALGASCRAERRADAVPERR